MPVQKTQLKPMKTILQTFDSQIENETRITSSRD